MITVASQSYQLFRNNAPVQSGTLLEMLAPTFALVTLIEIPRTEAPPLYGLKYDTPTQEEVVLTIRDRSAPGHFLWVHEPDAQRFFNSMQDLFEPTWYVRPFSDIMRTS